MGQYWFRKSWAKCKAGYKAKSKRFLGSSWRLTQLALVIAVALPLLLFACKWGRSPKSSPPSAVPGAVQPGRHTSSVVRFAEADPRARRLLPYSVIPGGALSADELKRALTNDPVVAGHYAGFDAARAHVVQVDHDRAVYVSYRLGNRVYWTSKRLTLLKGETILTDGDHEARTRCGNRISDAPQAPVSMKEPEQAVLQNPQFPILPADIPEWSFPLGDLILPSVGELEPPGGGFFVPPIIGGWGGGGGGGGMRGGTTVPTPPIPPVPPPDSPAPPPTATPEPASVLLLSSGLLGLWLRRKHSKS